MVIQNKSTAFIYAPQSLILHWCQLEVGAELVKSDSLLEKKGPRPPVAYSYSTGEYSRNSSQHWLIRPKKCKDIVKSGVVSNLRLFLTQDVSGEDISRGNGRIKRVGWIIYQ